MSGDFDIRQADDFDYVMEKLKKGNNLRYASERLKSNTDVVKEALDHNQFKNKILRMDFNHELFRRKLLSLNIEPSTVKKPRKLKL